VIEALEGRRTVAIIGAGPAGLMAAEVIASAGHAVTIYERMPSPARKFLMAGRGGLNLTHSEPLESFLPRYGSNAAAIRAAVSAFPPERVVSWANGLGQETFVGSSGRVFPKSMKASPLLRAWLRHLDKLGVELKTQHTWSGLSDNGATVITLLDGTALSLKPDAVVLALGGASWPRLGSDGAWVPILEHAGVSVTPLAPANCGVIVKWSDIFANRFAGSPLKRIAVTCGEKHLRGEAIITRAGLEGGVIYALGQDIRDALQHNGTASLTLDLKPDVTAASLIERLSKPQGSQSRSNFLRKAVALDAAAIGLLREAGPFSADATALAEHIKAVPLDVQDTAGLDRAISTAGGVQFTGITENFMLSARPGVFVAGEMLDWEAPTGGYLLQAAFATGVAAAEGVLKWIARCDGYPALEVAAEHAQNQ
jgi:uncharacterized flavoprotein (TIGR03862 family)